MSHFLNLQLPRVLERLIDGPFFDKLSRRSIITSKWREYKKEYNQFKHCVEENIDKE